MVGSFGERGSRICNLHIDATCSINHTALIFHDETGFSGDVACKLGENEFIIIAEGLFFTVVEFQTFVLSVIATITLEIHGAVERTEAHGGVDGHGEISHFFDSPVAVIGCVAAIAVNHVTVVI